MAYFAAFVHALLAQSLIAFAAVLGVWGSHGFIRHKAVSGGYRSSFLLLAGLTALQGLAGVVALTGFRPRQGLHLVYGIFAAVFLPGVYLYAARGSRAREAAFLAIACWIVLIAFGRGFATGH